MNKLALPILFIIFWVFIVAMQLHNVFSATMPFWYDPARDMLMGLDNLHKFSLIGPPSGISGIFYGPYWIWLLSFGEIISKDPSVVNFIVNTLPYLILLPIGLYLFVREKVFDTFTGILLWVAFAYAFSGYMSSIWNPNLAPLFYLYAIYFLLSLYSQKSPRRSIVYTFLAGILAGLALNFQISFSVGFVLGSFLYLIIASLIAHGKKIKRKDLLILFQRLLAFLLGIVFMFVPFLLFEVRHGFMQTKVAINAFLKGGGVVVLHGLSKTDILWSYFGRVGTLLFISQYILVPLIGFLLLVIAFLYSKKKMKFSAVDNNVIILLACITVGVLGIYLSAKNPIWPYHFIGVEIVALLLVSFILSKIKMLRFVLFAWIIYLTFVQMQGFMQSFQFNRLKQPSLYTKEQEVKTIIKDAGKTNYAVFAYNPSIYTYDYSYLFRWLANKDFSYDPGFIQRKKITYLIIPAGDKAKIEDFIHYRTPEKEYKTARTWNTPDGTVILKRIAL